LNWSPSFSAALWIYLVIGPGLAALVTVGMVVSRVRFLKIRTRRYDWPKGSVPQVAILIPAHNEGAGIEQCLRSVLLMEYPGELRVVAVDDRSTDDTLARMQEVARSDSRLAVVSVTEKPADWLGKCNALRVASEHAWAREAQWLLFVDSDVVVEPGALRATLSQALARGVDAVSILTRQRCETFLEKLLTPLACGAIVSMYFASATNEDNRRETAFANGQFFLIRRTVYDRVGGHAAVKDMPTEDVDLMRVLKRSGARCRLYAGDDLAETRMYDSLSRMLTGWARIYSGASHRRPWRILAASGVMLTLLGAFAMPWLSIGLGWGPSWLAAGGAHLALVLVILSCIYRWSGNAGWLAVLYPVALPFQLVFFGKALSWCLTNRMVWRGTGYSSPSAGPGVAGGKGETVPAEANEPVVR
jgi:cellulose synthase/poly-beta-1,6-N-acetylglucosamine synthase-like glycosyltransferase